MLTTTPLMTVSAFILHTNGRLAADSEQLAAALADTRCESPGGWRWLTSDISQRNCMCLPRTACAHHSSNEQFIACVPLPAACVALLQAALANVTLAPTPPGDTSTTPAGGAAHTTLHRAAAVASQRADNRPGEERRTTAAPNTLATDDPVFKKTYARTARLYLAQRAVTGTPSVADPTALPTQTHILRTPTPFATHRPRVYTTYAPSAKSTMLSYSLKSGSRNATAVRINSNAGGAPKIDFSKKKTLKFVLIKSLVPKYNALRFGTTAPTRTSSTSAAVTRSQDTTTSTMTTTAAPAAPISARKVTPRRPAGFETTTYRTLKTISVENEFLRRGEFSDSDAELLFAGLKVASRFVAALGGKRARKAGKYNNNAVYRGPKWMKHFRKMVKPDAKPI